jgi:hypothetical protein
MMYPTAAVMCVFLLMPAVLEAQQALPTGEAIMRNVNARPKGGDARLDIRLIFRDLRRGDHLRYVEVRRKQLASGYRSLYRMTAPEHLTGISLLLAEDRELPGMWMYLPNANHLVPVVTRGLSALASDFSCEDLRLTFALDDYRFTTIGSEVNSGHRIYKVEMVPRTDRLQAELGFTKAVGWVRGDLWMLIRAEYYDGGGKVFKTFSAEAPQLVQGVWTVRRYTMTNHRAQHETQAEVTAVRYGLQLQPGAFVPDALKMRGSARRQ